MNPTKHSIHPEEIEFSKRLESVRKDVECFFGIVKGRFRILKLPVMYRKQERIDNMFFTCVILHNMLHIYDGLGELEKGVKWNGVDGLHDCGLLPPDLDVTKVGSAPSAESVEVEDGHESLKKKLVKSFAYRQTINDIHWLQEKQSSSTGGGDVDEDG